MSHALLRSQESARLGRQIDVTEEEDRYVVQMAADMKLAQYNITEAQLKRVTFDINELETVHEGMS